MKLTFYVSLVLASSPHSPAQVSHFKSFSKSHAMGRSETQHLRAYRERMLGLPTAAAVAVGLACWPALPPQGSFFFFPQARDRERPHGSSSSSSNDHCCFFFPSSVFLRARSMPSVTSSSHSIFLVGFLSSENRFDFVSQG